ncbi:uncharacterized protein TNCT_400171 [Trichonephila clavata]|uniref:Mutator-like transposase domain-containing protein n=1 Tax=Trichonephila clavata TaxID=2740835 RepID=A0A8X6H7P2_TRICU|nr:uncharacterized protein TNCT_400171 [Trichonephila clavata]
MKLCKESDLDKEVRNSNQSNGYRLINIDSLLSELSQYVTCPNCNTKAVLKEKILYGLVPEFYVEWYSCSTLSTFKSSPVIASGKDYEVNTRITYAMRTVGQGFFGIKHFCTAMDLPPPVSQKAYEKILRKINLASCEVTDDSMKNAAKEEILASESNEICVSGDDAKKRAWHFLTVVSDGLKMKYVFRPERVLQWHLMELGHMTGLLESEHSQSETPTHIERVDKPSVC